MKLKGKHERGRLRSPWKQQVRKDVIAKQRRKNVEGNWLGY
jgi:hypothetical protein